MPTSVGSWKKQESSRTASISALLTMPKPLTVWIKTNCGKFLEVGIPDHLISLLRNLYAGQKATEFQKNIYFCFIEYTKVFVWITTNWTILQEMGIPDHFTCLLRNLYAGQEATARTGHGTMDRFEIGKGLCQDCILSPCLFNLYAEYIMQNARLDEAQAGIKISGRNINNLRYADDTVLMAENEEELRAS